MSDLILKSVFMYRSIRHLIVCLSLLSIHTGIGLAQEFESTADAVFVANAESSAAEGIFELPSEISDPFFDRYLDLALLEQAINAQDSRSLADVALQLAEGERILGRTSNLKGISSERFLLMAYELAVDTDDRETLDRLKRASSDAGNKALSDAIAATDKLDGESRTLLPGSTVPLSMTVETFYLLKGYIDAIRRARLLRDVNSLKSVEEELKGENDLPQDQHKRLIAIAADARESVEKNPAADDDTLMVMMDSSRIVAFPRLPGLPRPLTLVKCPCCNGTGLVSQQKKQSLTRILNQLLEGSSRSDQQLEEDRESSNEHDLLEGDSRGIGWVARPQNWGKTGIKIFPRQEESVSTIQVVSGPYIDEFGRVWSGSGSGGGGGAVVGKAQLKYNDQGLAFWVANYRNNYGQARSPIRASRHDVGEPLGLDDSVKTVFNTKSGKWHIYKQQNGKWTLIDVTN